MYKLHALSTFGEVRLTSAVTPTSNLLVTTTDTRMQKARHLAAHNDVEVAWWIEPTNVQFRISGPAITIASPETESSRTVQEKLEKLSPHGDEKNPEWWEQERARLWKSVSGHLRAGFARPAPGTPLDQADRKPEEWSESIRAESVCITIHSPLIRSGADCLRMIQKSRKR